MITVGDKQNFNAFNVKASLPHFEVLKTPLSCFSTLKMADCSKSVVTRPSLSQDRLVETKRGRIYFDNQSVRACPFNCRSFTLKLTDPSDPTKLWPPGTRTFAPPEGVAELTLPRLPGPQLVTRLPDYQ